MLRSSKHPRVTVLMNSRPRSGNRDALTLSASPSSLPLRRTSFVPAINLAAIRGAARIVLLGADGKFGPKGKRNHYSKYPFQHRPGCWEIHRQELASFVAPLAALGIDVVNASPGSAWKDLWPIVALEDCL